MQRRVFLASGAGAALSAQSANDRISVAVVGVGGRGTALLKEAIEFSGRYNARVTGVCDIWSERRNAASKIVRESYGGADPVAYPKLDAALADRNLDAVIIATPDHQHAKMLKAAVEAGKHVYCEKPLGNVLGEANAAMDAVKKSGRVVQIGTQRRSYPKYRAAARMIREGRIGQVVKADVIWNMYSPFRWARKEEELKTFQQGDIDWNEFLYGKPARPFDAKIYRSFRLFQEFSSGIVDQWMTHGIDVVHMLTGEPYPVSVVAHGGIFHWKDYRDTADTMEAVLEYGQAGKKFLATYATCLGTSAGRATRVMGTLGTLDLEDVWRISGDGAGDPKRITTASEIPDEPGTVHHMANWLDCVRRRDPAGVYCPADAGYGHSVACIMTVDAMSTGRRMRFDPASRSISAA